MRLEVRRVLYVKKTYQYRLTRFLGRFGYFCAAQLLQTRTLQLWYILRQTFGSAAVTMAVRLMRVGVFINGQPVTNLYYQLGGGDLIQLAVATYYQILWRW